MFMLTLFLILLIRSFIIIDDKNKVNLDRNLILSKYATI